MNIHGPTLDEARRAIFLDFEAETGEPPAVLGTLWVSRQGQEPMFRQYVVDPSLRRLSSPTLVSGSLAGQVRSLIGRAERQHRVLVGWSGHELEVVRAWCPELAPAFEALYRDAKTPAKAWGRLTGLRPAKDARKRRHRLVAYEAAAGFVRDDALGGKEMAEAIRRVRASIDGGVEPSQKRLARWERMLAHNEQDCRATRAVTLRALEDLAAETAVRPAKGRKKANRKHRAAA
jgi:hypothetical protein